MARNRQPYNAMEEVLVNFTDMELHVEPTLDFPLRYTLLPTKFWVREERMHLYLAMRELCTLTSDDAYRARHILFSMNSQANGLYNLSLAEKERRHYKRAKELMDMYDEITKAVSLSENAMRQIIPNLFEN